MENFMTKPFPTLWYPFIQQNIYDLHEFIAAELSVMQREVWIDGVQPHQCFVFCWQKLSNGELGLSLMWLKMDNCLHLWGIEFSVTKMWKQKFKQRDYKKETMVVPRIVGLEICIVNGYVIKHQVEGKRLCMKIAIVLLLWLAMAIVMAFFLFCDYSSANWMKIW